MKLLNNATANMVGPTFEIREAGNKTLSNQTHTFYVTGVFGGSTVTIQLSPDGMNPADTSDFNQGGTDPNAPLNANSRWLPLQTAAAITSDGYISVTDKFRKVRAVLTGASGTTNITVELLH